VPGNLHNLCGSRKSKQQMFGFIINSIACG